MLFCELQTHKTHSYEYYHNIFSSCVKDTVVLILDLIFTERIVNLWNTLPPDIVNFNSLSSFKRSIKLVNFSGFLKCFSHNVFFFLSFYGHPQVLVSSLVCPVQMFYVLLLSLLFCYLNK